MRTAAVDLDLYDLAHLAGGPERLIETALAALAESGRIRATRPTGELHVVSARPRHPVEAAVLEVVGARGNRTADGVRWRVASDDRIAAVGRRLEDAGLLSSGAGDPSARRPRWLPRLTPAGRRALRAARRELPADAVAGNTAALLVALRGPQAMPDAELRAAVFDPPRPALPAGPLTRGWTESAGTDARAAGSSAYLGGGAFGGWAALGGGGGDCGIGGGDGGGGC